MKQDEDKLQKDITSLVDEYHTISKEKQEETKPKAPDRKSSFPQHSFNNHNNGRLTTYTKQNI